MIIELQSPYLETRMNILTSRFSAILPPFLSLSQFHENSKQILYHKGPRPKPSETPKPGPKPSRLSHPYRYLGAESRSTPQLLLGQLQETGSPSASPLYLLRLPLLLLQLWLHPVTISAAIRTYLTLKILTLSHEVEHAETSSLPFA